MRLANEKFDGDYEYTIPMTIEVQGKCHITANSFEEAVKKAIDCGCDVDEFDDDEYLFDTIRIDCSEGVDEWDVKDVVKNLTEMGYDKPE